MNVKKGHALKKTYSCWKPFLKSTKKKSEKKEYDLAKETDFYIILAMLACKISISKFSGVMKFHLHALILQKEF